uniref:Hematopoietic cell signal transducer n=1 Tax=Dicentrarchus labrax TaxID=13489 RepID=A0A8C4F0Z2_DICLA
VTNKETHFFQSVLAHILHPTLLFCLCAHSLSACGLLDNTVSCYRIEPGTIAGIICADVLLTLIIVIVTYRCASFRRQKIDNADKVYMNVRANLKS